MAVNAPTGSFLLIVYPPFLWTGAILVFFQTSRNCQDAKQFSKSKVSGLHIKEAHGLSIFTEISSCLRALFGSTWLVEK